MTAYGRLSSHPSLTAREGTRREQPRAVPLPRLFCCCTCGILSQSKVPQTWCLGLDNERNSAMALPSQYARVVLNFADADYKIWQNVFWFELGGTFPSNYDVAAAANAVETHILTQLLAALSSDAIYLGLDLRINNGGVSSDAATQSNSAGTGPAGNIPNEVATIVHWQTAQPGGSGRGRTFFTGFAAAEVAGGRVSSAFNSIMGTLAAKILLSFSDQGITWGLRLLSKRLSTMYPIASYVIDSLVGTQRKRRPIR